ncbi:MAG: phage replisome organizer N-terminal domain-containing protein [Fusobacteriaceae bacterium]|jgi:predicted phage replisome organizer|nr:phage replisome organizer N-terminal domain-containing protein [Fusobacteriaceae bacterium]
MSKKYYWIKLKTDFFDLNEIDFLLSQKKGCEYIVLYQMLCLKSANNDGRLSQQVGEVIIAYDIDKIVRDTKYFDRDTVTVALDWFKKLGLIYTDTGRYLQITNFEDLVGHETKWAEKKRKQRVKEKEDNVLLLSSNMSFIKEDNVRQEIDIEIDKDKEIDINNSALKNELRLLIGDKNIKIEEIIKLNKPLKRIKEVFDYCQVNNKGEGYIIAALKNDYKLVSKIKTEEQQQPYSKEMLRLIEGD